MASRVKVTLDIKDIGRLSRKSFFIIIYQTLTCLFAAFNAFEKLIRNLARTKHKNRYGGKTDLLRREFKQIMASTPMEICV